jgi:adenylate cyclase
MGQKSISIPISLKIFGIAASLLGLLLLVAYSSQQRLRRLQQEVFDLSEYIIPITNQVDEVDTQALEQEVHVARIFKLYEIEPIPIAQIQAEQEKFEQRGAIVAERLATAITLAEQVSLNALTPADRQQLAQIQPQLVQIETEYQQFYNQAGDILDRLAQGERGNNIYALELALEAQEDHLNLAMASIASQLGIYTIDLTKLSQLHQQQVLRDSVVISLGAVLLGTVYASAVTFGIVYPLRHLATQVKALQAGETIEPLAVRSQDEVGRLNHSFNHMLQELAQKEKLKQVFGRYVDPRVVAQYDQYEATDAAVTTTGEKQIVTVLMSDVEGFATIAQNLPPERLVHIINLYLKLLSPAITEHQGFLEFVDTVMKGFWSPPFVAATDHGRLACEAALQQVAKLDMLKQLLGQEIGGQEAEIWSDLSAIDLHIGLATGPLILANMGPEWATVYTVLGDTVNTAARLKGVAKQFGVHILLLEETQQQVQNTMTTRELGLVRVVGKDDKLRIFELLGRQGELTATQLEWQATFAQGLAAYRQQNWDLAEAKFAACLVQNSQDKTTQRYHQSCGELRGQILDSDWDGTWILTKK